MLPYPEVSTAHHANNRHVRITGCGEGCVQRAPLASVITPVLT